MNAGFEVRGRWKIIDGPDMIDVWLDKDGFMSQRTSNYATKPIGHEPQRISYENLILMSEGQGKLL